MVEYKASLWNNIWNISEMFDKFFRILCLFWFLQKYRSLQKYVLENFFGGISSDTICTWTNNRILQRFEMVARVSPTVTSRSRTDLLMTMGALSVSVEVACPTS